jgi:ribosomal protein S18 acetylase RimI-like enzyme
VADPTTPGREDLSRQSPPAYAGSDLDIVLLGADDWDRYRSVRLAMLLDAPRAFASTFAHESRIPEEEWRRRLGGSPSWLALRGDLPLGSVTLFHPPDQPHGESYLVAMWVAGHARGGPAAQRLVETLLAHAESAGVERVVLDVATDNGRAAAFYRRLGFVTTGRTGILPHDPPVAEAEMVYAVGRP